MRNTIWTYTQPQVGHYPREDRYVLHLETRNRFYDWVRALAYKPFHKSGYGDNIWGDIWDWALHKGDDRAVIFATFEITQAEAEKIAPGIGAKLDLTWLDSQSSDEH